MLAVAVAVAMSVSVLTGSVVGAMLKSGSGLIIDVGGVGHIIK